MTHHLLDPHEHVRGVAATALGHLHALDAVPVLVQLTQDSSDWVRQALAESLGGIGGAERLGHAPAVDAAQWFMSPEPGSGEHSVARKNTLFLRGSIRSIWPFRRCALFLADASATVHIQAIRSLGEMGQVDSLATADLIRLLQDEDEAVRCQAAESLGQLKSPGDEAVAALAKLLEDPSPPIRVAAAKGSQALKKEAAEAVPALLPLLQEGDETVRLAAAEAVNQIGTMQGEALQTLGEGLTSQDNVVRARRPRRWARLAKRPPSSALLAEALQDDNDRVRAKAAEALGKMGEAAVEAVPGLVKAMRDQDNWVGALAAEALGEIGNGAAHAIPALVRSLHHVNPTVRANAAEALGKMGATATPALSAVDAVKDAEDEVRRQVIFALGEIGGLGRSGSRILLTALEDGNPNVLPRRSRRWASEKNCGRRAQRPCCVPPATATIRSRLRPPNAAASGRCTPAGRRGACARCWRMITPQCRR